MVRRTSDSLNGDLPVKWPDKSLEENDIFSMEKIVGSALQLSAKRLFSLDKNRLKKIWGENSVFAIQHIGNRKRFFVVLSPDLDPNCLTL